MSLHACPHCQRHVRAAELTCPFCAGELEPRRETQFATSTARLTRAALFAGAGLLGVGCAPSDKAPPPAPAQIKVPVNTGDAAPPEPPPPPPPPIDAAPQPVQAADAAPTETRVPAADAAPARRKIHAKPYGAPPNRVRRA